MAHHIKTKKKLVKAASIVSFSTVCSRLSGLVRDMVCANLFGVSRVWDAFVYAFMIPNLLRRLVGDGALSGAFIPVYAQILKTDGKEEAERVANIVFSLLITALGIFLFCVHWGIRAVLLWVPLGAKIALSLKLLLILFPYIFFLALVAVYAGILQCHKKFFVPAMTPFLLNIIWIATVLVFSTHYGSTPQDKIIILAWGVLFAGFIQFLVNYLMLRRLGFRSRFILDVKHPILPKIATLMLPAALGFSMTQINVFVDLSLAMFLGDGANSALWYGNRLMQFPLGVFGIAIATALLPTISHQVAEKKMEELKSTLSFSLRAVFIVVIPASVGLIVLGVPIIRLLFERGEFTAMATERTALALLCYSIGLFAYAGVKLLVSAFYSLQDTKTPVKIGAVCMLLNIGCNLVFMQFLREAGLALATAVSSTLNFVFLTHLLHKKIGAFEGRRILLAFARITVLSLCMGIGVHFFYAAYVPVVAGSDTLSLALRLGVSIVFGALGYVAIGFVFRVPEFYTLWRTIRKRA
jgi:putative peptidoglycan lipid II flippase